MSQHLFKTTHQGCPITVLMGWDPPLGHVFLAIERDEPALDGGGEAADEYLYSTLLEPDPLGMTLADFRRILARFGIQVPESLFREVERDRGQHRRGQHTGLRRAWHNADGTFRDETLHR